MCVVGPLSSVLISPDKSFFVFCLLGAMASKEEQAVKNLNMENANQENEKKNEEEQVANKGEPLVHPLEAGEYCVSRVNHRPLCV